MKILVIHQYYVLPGMAGGSRFNEFAKHWAAAGHDVTVVAGGLDYSTGRVPKSYRRRWNVREDDGPVAVWRCYVPESYSRSYAGRMWAFAGFTASATTAALRVGRPDVVIATSPPLIAAIPGWLSARAVRRVPLIFEVRDLWPESAVTTGVLRQDSTITKGLYALERFACRTATLVNVLTPAFREDLIARGLVRAQDIVFIPNGADVDLFKPGPRDNAVRRELGWRDSFVALYAGAHGRANAVGQLVATAELLRNRADLLIACVGDGPERSTLEAEVVRRGLSNIRFYGARPKTDMPDYVNACDVGLAVLQRNPTFRTVYPNKVFDYMACERATVLGIDGVARDLVCTEARAGVYVEPENPSDMSAALVRLAEDPASRAEMGRRGRAWVLANATRDGLATRYLEAMQEAVRRHDDH